MMIDTLFNLTLMASLVSLCLLAAHGPLLKLLGARTVYTLWLLLPFSLLVVALGPWLAALLNLVLPGDVHAVLETIEITPSVVAKASESSLVLTFSLAIIWALGALSMLTALLFDAYALKALPSTRRHRQVLLYTTAEGVSPALMGVRRPHLMLPADFRTRYSASERRLIIRHELTHWRRHDTQLNLIAWVFVSLQWFNPIVWLAYRRFRADQELACDAQVLARTSASQVTTYAQSLLKTMSSQPAPVSNTSIRREAWHGPSSTSYFNQRGHFKMAKERLSNLQGRTSQSLIPLLMLSTLFVSASALAFSAGSDGASATTNEQKQEKLSPIVRVEPGYPRHAVEAGIEGYVDLQFEVDNNGEVTNLKVLKSEPEGIFEEAVTQAVKKWRYEPVDNVQTQVRIEMRMN